MKILIVDDEELSREAASRCLKSMGHEFLVASDGLEALKVLLNFPADVIVSDLYMPGINGLELCRRLRSCPRDTYTYFILLTVAEKERELSQAMEAGVDDFISKPLNPVEITARLSVASRISKLHMKAHPARGENSVPEEQAPSLTSFEGMIGQSKVMEEVFRRIRLASRSQASVLLSGQSGTGKELSARAIHNLSERAGKPFIATNCAAITNSILESELFGHVKGAFTGAIRERPGLFQMGDGGTIFLDEISEISADNQVKLLRAIQEQEFRPVGGDRPVKVNIRLIASTNRDLREAIRKGEFREDLYYRMRVFQIDLPPLREHRDDIPLIAAYFMKEFSRQYQKQIDIIEPPALEALMAYPWPGNVRELRNAIEHAFVILPKGPISAESLPAEIHLWDQKDWRTLGAGDTAFQSSEILEALSRTKGNRSEAARLLGISRVALWKRIRRLGIASQLPPSSRGNRETGRDPP